MDKKVICPACGGDGKETCTNPDHGFLMMGGGTFLNANESACPCCGHDDDHKIKKWDGKKYVYQNCNICDGTGAASIEAANDFCDETGYDNELIELTPSIEDNNK